MMPGSVVVRNTPIVSAPVAALCVLLVGLLTFLPVREAAAEPNQLTYALYDDIKDWDPSVAFSLEVTVLANVYETLVRYDPSAEDKLVPALA